jgi:hypothetical protein
VNGLVPIDRMGASATYQGRDGGLYGSGSNQPPEALLTDALAAAKSVVPRNDVGVASGSGKVGVIAIGQSTTKQWFPYFQRTARQLPDRFVFVNAGQDNVVAQKWVGSSQPWIYADRMVAGSGLSRFQVQVAFIDSVRIRSWNDGNLAQQVAAYSANLDRIVGLAKANYPNLRLVYLLPFHDAQYAGPRRMLREPYTYQLGFGIRQLVETQGQGSTVLLWGPYVWSAVSDPSYFYDGIHFSHAGRAAMSSLMWNFLQQDPAAGQWLWNHRDSG